jgi:hypothetical protein
VSRSSTVVAILIGCSVLAGCAAQSGGTSTPKSTATSASGRQCFTPGEVNSYTATKDGNVDVKVGANRYYHLTLGGGCPNVDWSQRVGIRATGGSSFICEGLDAELIVPDPSIAQQRCPVTDIHAITREQFLADQKNS